MYNLPFQKPVNICTDSSYAFGSSPLISTNNCRKKSKAKPGDILGAIAGESGLDGRLVGTIDMYDKYTFVEVPREYAKTVLKAMKHAKIKGKSVAVEPANQK